MTTARPDTIYLASSPITTDTSQFDTDLTVAAPGGYELLSERAAIDGTGDGRALEVSVSMTNTDTGELLDHDAGNSYAIVVKTGGVVEFRAGGVVVASLTAPGIGASPKDYVIAWATEPNPATTGAGDALRSEVLIYTVAGPTWQVATHAVVAASTTGTFTVGGQWTGGTMINTFTGTIYGASVSGRWHTRIEVRERWVAASAAPSIEGITACQTAVWPEAALEVENGAGPGYQAASGVLATGVNRHRLASPIVQVLIPSPPTWESDLVDDVGEKWVHELGHNWQAPLCWVWRRKIPEHFGYLRVEVQWATWDTLGGAPDMAELRAHAADGPPADALEQATQTIDRDIDDGTNGLGVLEDFPLLRIVRDDDEYTWLFFSSRTDGPNVAYSIRAITITPVATYPAFDNGPPAEWGP